MEVFMSQRKVSQNNDVGGNPTNSHDSGPVVALDIDLAVLQAEPAAPRKLSVETDFDLEALRAGPDAEAVVRPDFDSVMVDKPKKTMYVYVHPEWRIEAYLLEPEETERQYTHLLLPNVAHHYPQICRKAMLAPYADRENGMYLLPVLLEDAAGNLNKYSRSLLERIRQGAGQWCRYRENTVHQRYDMFYAEEQVGPPEWPAGGLSHLVNAAFRGNIVTNTNTEILRRRLGRPAK
jgi:hypothetical protein